MKTLLLTLLLIFPVSQGLAQTQSPTTKALDYFLNACWHGQFIGSEDTDVHCYRQMVNSQFVRDNHMVNSTRGKYGGETIFWWDNEKQHLNYTYWDTNGGVSTGLMRKTEEGFVSPDETYEGRNGEKMVIRTRWLIMSNDKYIMESVKVDGNKTSRMFAIEYKRGPLKACPGPECDD